MNPSLFTLMCLSALAVLGASSGRAAPAASVEGGMVRIAAGEYAVAGRTVTLAAPVRLAVPKVDSLAVRDEAYVLSNDAPHVWLSGTHLRGCLSASTVLPGCLVPGSVVVKLPNGAVMENGRDYLLDEQWASVGRAKDGRIPDGGLALVSYRVGLRRLDSVVVDARGRASLVRGTPHKATPQPPDIGNDMHRVANVYMPYQATEVQDWQLFPVGDSFPEPGDAEMARRGAMIPKTLDKLRRGEPVTIVAWGDSVTVGGDASPPDRIYPSLFLDGLRARFPKSNIFLINAGIGATNTSGRLPSLQREVLDAHPDLVTIEFVNDLSLPDEVVRANWRKALDAIHGAGAEAITLTPHFVMPEWMAKEHPRGGETRSGVAVMREVSREKGVGVADASLRWAHLDEEGLPYITLLASGINHPDNRGHALYARELLTFFPTVPAGG
jgi:lysophospholipase L1-like esterase